MGNYYRTNAIYDFIKGKYTDQFFLPSENSWHLVYGTKDADPKVLLSVFATPSSKIESSILPEEAHSFSVLQSLQINSTTILQVRFADDVPDISDVTIRQNGCDWHRTSLKKLSEKFSQAGLPINPQCTAKAINDMSSSAFHNWQRTYLGSSIIVSDLDLYRIAETQIVAVFELKRSFYSLEGWKPFKDDYPNFKLLYNLLKQTNIPLYIIYNQRQKNPWKDDISKLKIYSVNFGNSDPIQLVGTYELEDFIRGSFLV